MRIGTREIGPDLPVYVIAEIGVNHDGEVERALMLTEAAASAGADAIKLQFFKTEKLMSKAARLAAYQRAAGESDPIEMLRRLELSLDDMARVVDRAHEIGIHAIVSLFSKELVAPAMSLAWDALKTASPDIIHRPLLEAMMATGRPIILSTGASEIEEIERAVRWVAPARDRLAMLHCVSSYPTPDDQAHLRMASDLRRVEPALPIGYSDHTVGIEVAGFARALALSILEKHLTYSTEAAGPDHAASLSPDRFAAYVRRAREPAAVPSEASLLGEATKRVLEIEREVRALSRQSIVARHALRAGRRVARGDLTFKRPGTGIEPYHVNDIVGRALARDVEADMPLAWDDLAPGDGRDERIGSRGAGGAKQL